MAITATCDVCGQTTPVVHEGAKLSLPQGWRYKEVQGSGDSDAGKAWCSMKCISDPENGMGAEDLLLGRIAYGRHRIAEGRARGHAMDVIASKVETLCAKYREKYERDVPYDIECEVQPYGVDA